MGLNLALPPKPRPRPCGPVSGHRRGRWKRRRDSQYRHKRARTHRPSEEKRSPHFVCRVRKRGGDGNTAGGGTERHARHDVTLPSSAQRARAMAGDQEARGGLPTLLHSVRQHRGGGACASAAAFQSPQHVRALSHPQRHPPLGLPPNVLRVESRVVSA